MGKEKGGEFERSVCNRLSLWVSGMKRADVFWRSAMSGGRACLLSQSKKGLQFDAQSGDITAIHELGLPLLSMFVVECKFIKDLEMGHPIFGHTGEITRFWEKLLGECRLAGGKLPMIIAKQNRQREIVGVNREGYDILFNLKPSLQRTCHYPQLDLHVYSFADVIASIPYYRMDEAIKHWNAYRQKPDAPTRIKIKDE